MSIPGNTNPLLLRSASTASAGISRSLRFNSSDSGYCAFTPSSVGNRKTFTFSAWVKRTTLSSAGYKHIFSTGTTLTESGYFGISFWEDKLDVTTGAADLRKTSAVYRDTSAWYHIVVAVDTTQGTAANRVKVYVNGLEVTAFQTSNNPSPSADLAVSNTVAHNIGRNTYNSSDYFDGYLAEIWFIGGLALTPNDFGETNQITGQWIPKRYTGSTAGTNTYQLTFSDNSNTTATTLGKDTSGNGLNWTPNNFSVTAGAGNDSLVDTPTSFGTGNSGGDVRGNYATLNPLQISGSLSNGNLDASVNNGVAYSTIAMSSGKWYFEMTAGSTGGHYAGIYATVGLPAVNTPTSYAYACPNNSTIGIAVDITNGYIWYAINGVWQASGNPETGANPNPPSASNTPNTATIQANQWVFSVQGGSGANTSVANFGQRAFAYTAPSGFKALCDTNLAPPLVAKPNTVMDVALYTGNGSARSITGLGFSPDMVWIKSRSAAGNHRITDIVRGATKELSPDLTNAEGTDANGVTSFDANGFSLGISSFQNGSGTTYAAWAFDAGSSTVSNTQGSITSSVRANASAGFSIVTYTSNATAGSTVGHGLGVAPEFVIARLRNQTASWAVYHRSLGASKYILLNSTNAEVSSTQEWGGTAPTSTVVTIGNSSANNNAISGSTAIMYAFAPVAGYSSFGSYTGNGSTDGPFVYTGMRPRWLLLKASSAGESYPSWRLFDTARDTYNASGLELYPNLNLAEADSRGSGQAVDILSNGFKLRASNTWNTSGVAYIYCSFAENPFQYARAR